jgi:hypothetical protein
LLGRIAKSPLVPDRHVSALQRCSEETFDRQISMDASSIAMEALQALQKAGEPWPV